LPHGSRKEILERCGLGVEGIVEKGTEKGKEEDKDIF
jgi:hypothetical protein